MTTINGANPLSLQLRQDRARIRRDLNTGTLTLEDVLTEPPPALVNVALFVLMTWRRGWGPDRLRKLGALAVRDHVNLAVSAGVASHRTRQWLIGHDRVTARYQP